MLQSEMRRGLRLPILLLSQTGEASLNRLKELKLQLLFQISLQRLISTPSTKNEKVLMGFLESVGICRSLGGPVLINAANQTQKLKFRKEEQAHLGQITLPKNSEVER